MRRRRDRHRLGDERGVVAVVFALTLVVLLGSVALTVDVARVRQRRQVLQTAVDFGALAAAHNLPVVGSAQGTTATADAVKVTLANASKLTAAGVTTTFRCIVGTYNKAPDLRSVPGTCGPSSGTWTTGWTQRGTTYSHACNPGAGDRCNAVNVQATDTVRYFFAPVIGYSQGSTGTVSASACKGTCGKPATKLDVVLVFDRTVSLSAAELANAKKAALAVLDVYSSSIQSVGLVVLPYGDPNNPCDPKNPQVYPNGSDDWWSIGLNSNYDKADGTLDTNSALVKRINCLTSKSVGNNKGSGNTDLADPLQSAQSMLDKQGRSDAPDVIILFTDGEANQTKGTNPCKATVTVANTAKNKGTEIYVIAYGVAGARCGEDTSGTYANAYATKFLSDVATSSTDNLPGGCATTENSDGDRYFCESNGADLEPAFRSIAATSASKYSSLVDS